MPSTIILKRRISSIRSTRQITKAMQLVSASKLRRAQVIALRSRDYRALAYELLQRMSNIQEVEKHELFVRRPLKQHLYILITSNSGLAGAYNANVLKEFLQHVTIDQDKSIKSKAIVIGNKGANFVRRLADIELIAVYQPFDDHPTPDQIRPLLNSLLELYRKDGADAIDLIYTSFISTIRQQVTMLPLLPAAAPTAADHFTSLATFEPDTETVIDQVVVRLVEAQIWQAVLESLASEYAMRMVATKNATDNANELIDDYTLELNNARQAAITQELAEITGGAEALND